MRLSRPIALVPAYNRGVTSFRAIFRSSEAALIILAVLIGIGAGVLMIAQHAIAHGAQVLFYGLSGASLSAAPSIQPLRLADASGCRATTERRFARGDPPLANTGRRGRG